MCWRNKPTRHETGDIANTVIDGVDGFILDRETAEGDYPVQAVNWLVKSALEAEKIIDWRKEFNDIKLYSVTPYGTAESVACAAVAAVLDLKVDLIVIFTETGKIARLVTKYKPQVPVIVVSQQEDVIQ